MNPSHPPINMKRHLISDETGEKDFHKRCARTNLSILGNCQTLICENRDNSEIENRDFKKPRLQLQRPDPATSIKIEEDAVSVTVASAVTPICDEVLKVEKPEDDSTRLLLQQQQYRQQENRHKKQRQREDQANSSGDDSTSTRSSRSDSLSSELSVYRSYEMEIPDQPPQYRRTGQLPRAPRLPTASDVPQLQESFYNSNKSNVNHENNANANNNTELKLNTRRYGADSNSNSQHSLLGQRGYHGNNTIENKVQTIETTNPLNQIRIQTVIYH